jgi:uncharacterized protein YjbI with pentapeptide repeats
MMARDTLNQRFRGSAMANPEHVKLVRQGAGAIARWRTVYPSEIFDLVGADLRRAGLEGADLRGADLQGATLWGADLQRANLQGTFLRGADLQETFLSEINLQGADLSEIQLNGVYLRRVNLQGARLQGASLEGANLYEANLKEADLHRANLKEADLHRANFEGADLRGADLQGATLLGASLRGALLQGAFLQRANLQETNFRGAFLEGANLQGAFLKGANLQGVPLRRAVLRRANFEGADLRGADLQGAFLEGANLRGSLLKETNLRGVPLQGALLERANLQEANFQEANLIDACLDRAVITGASLWETQRSGWSIQDIICERVYWDRNNREQETFGPGDFERLYADNTKIILRYEGGINPIEIATLPALIQQMEARYPGCVLHLRSIEDGPSGATVTLVVEDPGEVGPSKIEAMKAELEERGQALIIAERAALEAHNQREKIEYALRYLSHEVLPNLVRSVQPKYAISIPGGGPLMIVDTPGDIYNVPGQAGAVGRGAHAHDMTFNQLWSQSAQSFDLPALAAELTTLRQAMRKEADEPFHDKAVVEIGEAQEAAQNHDGPRVLQHLKNAGQWALDVATKIGVNLVTEALKKALGS